MILEKLLYCLPYQLISLTVKQYESTVSENKKLKAIMITNLKTVLDGLLSILFDLLHIFL